MKILLTGLPKTGKTTLIQGLLPLMKNPFWAISTEIQDPSGQRLGFQTQTSSGLKGVIAHKTGITSPAQVGGYQVDILAVDRLFTEPIVSAVDSGQSPVIIDEIGRIQMLAPAFALAITRLLDSPASVIATIRHGDDWAQKFTDRSDVAVLELTPDNRESIKATLQGIIAAEPYTRSLSDSQTRQLTQITRRYCQSHQFTQLQKLYRHAVKYVARHQVKPQTPSAFIVEGDHGHHQVVRQGSTWHCDCDLANGRGQYAGRAGECSHIQAAKIA